MLPKTLSMQTSNDHYTCDTLIKFIKHFPGHGLSQDICDELNQSMQLAILLENMHDNFINKKELYTSIPNRHIISGIKKSPKERLTSRPSEPLYAENPLLLCGIQYRMISRNFSFLLTYFPQKRIIISEMGNHRQESSCQIVENFIFRRVPAK